MIQIEMINHHVANKPTPTESADMQNWHTDEDDMSVAYSSRLACPWNGVLRVPV